METPAQPGQRALPGTLTTGCRVGALLALVLLPRLGQAQDIDPRRWSHLPIGSNFAGVGYGYTDGTIALDPVLRIQNGQFDLNTVAVKYIHSFALLDKSARVEVAQPYAIGHWSGLLDGRPAAVNRSGLDDTSLRFAVNLFGAPPLKGQEFADYRASKADKETIVGFGFGLQLPTGQYYSDKLINLGDNRYTFRPQMGAEHNWGKWAAEFTVQGWFYTDNTDFYNGRKLTQDPVYTGDASVIYTFRPGLWAAGSIGYAGGGTTSVNGRTNNNDQSSIGFGFSVGLPISHTVGVKLYYLGSRTQVGTGVDSDTYAIALSVMF